MATYIQNIQDKVTTVRPPETDWQFEAQLLSTRQAKYDAGHKKISDMYGKILNSGLTRNENIEAREEFFKLIDGDLRKVAGLDLSLESNISQAENVFNQVYENDFLVKDMVWTKNYQNEMQRAESFKNCVDIEKCGGSYWDDGVKYMNYKREEFKNSSNEESMSAQNVRYIPYNNLMDDAIKMADAAGLKVTRDEKTGKYITRTVNGVNVVSPLTRMFDALYSKNPKFQDQYELQAYNSRKDWTYGAVQRGEFETLEDAALGYVELKSNEIIDASDKIMESLDMDVSSLKSKIKALENDFKNKVYGAQDQGRIDDLEGYREVLAYTETAKGYTDMVRNAQKNMNNLSSMEAIGSVLDQSLALNLLNGDLQEAGEILAHRDMEVTLTADEFELNDQKFKQNIYLENMRINAAKAAAKLKAEAEDPWNLDDVQAMNGLQLATNELKTNFLEETLLELADTFPAKYGTLKDKITDFTLSGLYKYLQTGGDLSGEVRTLIVENQKKENKAKMKVNAAIYTALEKTNMPIEISDVQWDVMNPIEYTKLKNRLGNRYYDFNAPAGVAGYEEPFGAMVYSHPNTNNLYIKKHNPTTFKDEWYRSNNDNPSTMMDFVKVTGQANMDDLEVKAKPYKSQGQINTFVNNILNLNSNLSTYGF